VLLAQAVFTLLLRNAKLDDHAASGMRGELKLFQRFNQMIDSHYHQHWTVPEYASELHLTESRLTDICRRFANRPPKRLIFDRQLREARRLLLFSDSAVNEIAWQLGFKDPAYFARFLPLSGLLAQQLPGAESTGVPSLACPRGVSGEENHKSIPPEKYPLSQSSLHAALSASIKQQKQNINLTLFSDTRSL
jgi:AraC-like DNA-binding protein